MLDLIENGDELRTQLREVAQEDAERRHAGVGEIAPRLRLGDLLGQGPRSESLD